MGIDWWCIRFVASGLGDTGTGNFSCQNLSKIEKANTKIKRRGNQKKSWSGSSVILLLLWSSEAKFNNNKFFLIPSLVLNLPDDWQDDFAQVHNVKCLTLYPSEDELNLLRELSRRNKQSMSVTVRRALDSYLQKKSWGVNILPQSALKRKSCSQLSIYLFEEQINKLKYLSSQTNRPVINLVTETISKYCS